MRTVAVALRVFVVTPRRRVLYMRTRNVTHENPCPLPLSTSTDVYLPCAIHTRARPPTCTAVS